MVFIRRYICVAIYHEEVVHRQEIVKSATQLTSLLLRNLAAKVALVTESRSGSLAAWTIATQDEV